MGENEKKNGEMRNGRKWEEEKPINSGHYVLPAMPKESARTSLRQKIPIFFCGGFESKQII